MMISHEISRSSNKFSNNPYIEQAGPETDHGMDPEAKQQGRKRHGSINEKKETNTTRLQ
jgi:hypothetical protein